jgi:hypothetical protein
VLVWWADLNHSYIAWKSSAAIKFLSLAEEYRDIVSITSLNTLTHIGAYEKCLVEKDSIILWIRIWCRTFCMQMVDADVTKFSGISSFT